ncbi:hypothetical protein GCM10008966_18320 [Rhodovulum strictum]
MVIRVIGPKPGKAQPRDPPGGVAQSRKPLIEDGSVIAGPYGRAALPLPLPRDGGRQVALGCTGPEKPDIPGTPSNHTTGYWPRKALTQDRTYPARDSIGAPNGSILG